MSWTVILPVKRLATAKSRLRGAVIGVAHEDLVLAMARDTVVAVLASPVVGRAVVVSADPLVGDAAVAAGAEFILDLPDAGLNPALAYAATVVRPPGATASLPGVAAIPADLPALRPTDLTAALHQAATGAARFYVADAAGTGTVLLAARPGAGLEPCFGAGSAGSHAASGAVALTGDWPSLRCDVDTADDLADAIRLGLGAHTHAILLSPNSGGSAPVAASPDDARPDRLDAAAVRGG